MTNLLSKNLHIYPTMNCQLNCKYCYVDFVNKDKNTLEVDDYKDVFIDAKKLGILTVDIAGGEPLLYKHIVELLDMIHQYGFKSHVVTNGVALNKYINYFDVQKELIDILHLSLDSANSQLHDSIRGKQGAHKASVENIKEYIKRNISPVYINYVLQKESFSQLGEMLDFSKNIGAKGIDIQYVLNVGEKNKDNSLALTIFQIIDSLKCILQWSSLNYNLDFFITLVLPGYVYPLLKKEKIDFKSITNINLILYPRIGLKNWYDTIVIDHSGNVTGSITAINRPEWYIGNIKKDRLINIWDNSLYMREKIEKNKMGKFHECCDCISKRYCGGNDVEIFSDLINTGACKIKESLNQY